MATERVYHPETCEPFDVPASKASSLVLDKGWSRTPWTRVAVAPVSPVVIDDEPDAMTEDDADAPVVAEPARGRGRRRRAAEAVASEDDDTPTWRS